ncbi:formylglycine-generating enzyme required for sulfatase activity [Bradyrhizobium sp. JR3.5]
MRQSDGRCGSGFVMSFTSTKNARGQAVERSVDEGMVYIPGGAFRMGSDGHYPEEAPAHRVVVDGFWIDRAPVTNLEFREFINATGYVTFAELTPDAKDYPNALPHMLKAGSLVFTPPKTSCRPALLGRMVDV